LENHGRASPASARDRRWRQSPRPIPDDIDALKAAVLLMGVQSAAAEARASAADALVAQFKLQIALLRRDKYGAGARKPFPAHSPRERIVVPVPCACPSCGGERLSNWERM
jgi:transposase